MTIDHEINMLGELIDAKEQILESLIKKRRQTCKHRHVIRIGGEDISDYYNPDAHTPYELECKRCGIILEIPINCNQGTVFLAKELLKVKIILDDE